MTITVERSELEGITEAAPRVRGAVAGLRVRRSGSGCGRAGPEWRGARRGGADHRRQ
ncbi:MAG TPA: hypothetical protein VD973_10505 [Symbiobacteriaceae bacterium]|nr:hypothetical protein [Symbiobacteriaceae bacterium]